MPHSIRPSTEHVHVQPFTHQALQVFTVMDIDAHMKHTTDTDTQTDTHTQTPQCPSPCATCHTPHFMPVMLFAQRVEVQLAGFFDLR